MKFTMIRSSGFTLVELLITIIILSSMMVLASVALRNMLLSWERLSVPFPKEAVVFHRLQGVFHSLMPYANYQSDGYGAQKDTVAFFFNGKKESCSFITASPLVGNAPAFVRIYVDDNRLMYSETVLHSRVSDYQDPQENADTKLYVLMDTIHSIQLTYREQEWKHPFVEYPYPSLVRLRLERMDGTVVDYSFVIRSNYPEKLQMIQKMGQNV